MLNGYMGPGWPKACGLEMTVLHDTRIKSSFSKPVTFRGQFRSPDERKSMR